MAIFQGMYVHFILIAVIAIALLITLFMSLRKGGKNVVVVPNPARELANMLAHVTAQRVICVCGQKGGTGKTTASLAIATEWRNQGKRVVLIDADPQGSISTWAQVAIELGQPVPTVVSIGAELLSGEQIPYLDGTYDYVIFDCPAGHGHVQRAALLLSDTAILPCGPAAFDVWSLAETIDLVSTVQQSNPRLAPHVLITRQVSTSALGRGARDALLETGLNVLRSELGYRVAYAEAPAAGLGVTTYAPGSQAAKEVIALTQELDAMGNNSWWQQQMMAHTGQYIQVQTQAQAQAPTQAQVQIPVQTQAHTAPEPDAENQM